MTDKKREEVSLMPEHGIRHIAFIMDGNGRWAKKRGLPRSAGHIQGAKAIAGVLQAFRNLGVHHVTLYAFSTENWKRPKDEVDTLMELAYKYIDEVAIKKIKSEKVTLSFFADCMVMYIENMRLCKNNLI